MRRSTMMLAAAAVGIAAWCNSASAQRVGVELYVGPSPTYEPYYGYTDYHYGPSTYRHSRRYYSGDVDVDVVPPRRRCPYAQYWNGRECAHLSRKGEP